MQKFNPSVLKDLHKPAADSHKGQNGRLLVIGGSKLFHASIFWAADVAAKIVDLVHFTSPANENNELVRKKLKDGFWNGIVVDWGEVESYISEDDCVLIGPGMPREDGLLEDEEATGEIVNRLLSSYPDKRWVVDGGALQEVDTDLLNGNMMITPHMGEWNRLMAKTQNSKLTTNNHKSNVINDELVKFSRNHGNLTVLLKGREDLVCRGGECVCIEGGNPGMTKGGTGDVLAGLAAALYCKNDAFLSAQAASYVNKKAGEALAERVGNNFDAGDLVREVPKVLFKLSK